MSKITKNKVRVGDTNGYEVAYDSAADQLNIKDLENSNTITIDVGQEILADKLDAANQIALPVYSDNSNAPTEDGSIWFNDGSGGDTAGIYIYDGTVTGPYNTGSGSSPGNLSGLTIDTDKGWSGYVITGVGHDSVRVPVSRDLTVADFEEGVLDTDVWSGDTGSYSVSTTHVKNGNYSLKGTSTGGTEIIDAPSGLQHQFQKGDTGTYYVFHDSNTQQTFTDIRTENGGWRTKIDSVNGDIVLNDPSGNDTITNVSVPLNEWIQVDWTWGLDDKFTIDVFDSNGNSLASISATDSSSGDSGYPQ
ncbi:MAG: hypothetical protein ABEK59_11710, partial [Halobacteria archaeon]